VIMADENLLILTYRCPTLPVGLPLVFRFLPFVNLAGARCFLQSHAPLFNIHRSTLAIALPNLEALTLGEWLCSANTYPTVVCPSSFPSSIPRGWNIQVRTGNLRTNTLPTLGYPDSHGPHSRLECTSQVLVRGKCT